MTLPSLPSLGATSWFSWATGVHNEVSNLGELAVILRGTGIDPTGATSSQSAMQALITAAPTGAHLWLPAGLYLVDGITLKNGQTLTGPEARSYSGTPSGGARLKARLGTQTAPVLTTGSSNVVLGISVEGTSLNQPCIRSGGSSAFVQRVSMLGGSIGFDGAYFGPTVVTGCMIHDNVNGLQNTVDSLIVGNYIAANTGIGIILGTGANDNTIIGNKIEWNDGDGINAFQADSLSIIGGTYDRQGKTAIRAVQCSQVTISAPVLKRNGRLSSGTSGDDAHIHQEGCTRFVLSGATTATGANDDGTGYTSPAASVFHQGGTDITYLGNALAGHVSGSAVVTAAAGTNVTFAGNSGYTGVQATPGSRTQVGESEFALAGSATATATFTGDAIGNFETGKLYRLTVAHRNGSTGVRSLAQVAVLVSREGGAASVTLGTVDNQVSSNFGTTTGTYRLTATVSTDGTTITLSVQNTGTDGGSIIARLV